MFEKKEAAVHLTEKLIAYGRFEKPTYHIQIVYKNI